MDFFFSSRRRHTSFSRDWSSDVCSSDLKLKQHDRSIGHRFVQDILKIDEVVECYNISGDYDFILKVFAKDMQHYQEFVFNKLGAVESIGSTHSSFVMAEIKNAHNITF